MLVELGLVEQRYQAVLEVLNEASSVSDVAVRFGVTRQTVHRWLRRYAADGLAGLVDGSARPLSCPHQMPPVALLAAADVGIPIDGIAYDADWRRRLDAAIPHQPVVHRTDGTDLAGDIRRAIDGTLGLDADVLEANRSYAYHLARELERLIGGEGSPAAFSFERPDKSPDGILRSLASDEARRAVGRLAESVVPDDPETSD